MGLWNQYHLPDSVEQAVAILDSAGPNGAVVAGGTDLLLDLQQGRHPKVEALIDVNHIPELQKVDMDETRIFIGAGVPLSKIVTHELLRFHAPGLVEACNRIGGPQVRNVATLGGNVGHALPAGDGTIALLPLNTETQLASSSGRRWVALDDLFEGPGITSFDRTKELIVGFRFAKRGELDGSASKRIMRPQGVAIAILNMAIWLRANADAYIEDLRIAIGPASPTPFRARGAENRLKGQRYSDEWIATGVGVILEEARLRTSRHRATETYRRHLIEILLRRCMDHAVRRAMSGVEGSVP